jgi:hypothetical protein
MHDPTEPPSSLVLFSKPFVGAVRIEVVAAVLLSHSELLLRLLSLWLVAIPSLLLLPCCCRTPPPSMRTTGAAASPGTPPPPPHSPVPRHSGERLPPPLCLVPPLMSPQALWEHHTTGRPPYRRRHPLP